MGQSEMAVSFFSGEIGFASIVEVKLNRPLLHF
jgi:hypothetical protein